MSWDREKGLEYLNSPAFVENTYENIRRNSGYTDDNNSGSTADEEEDFLSIMRAIRERGEREGWDKGGSSEFIPRSRDPYEGHRRRDIIDVELNDPYRRGYRSWPQSNRERMLEDAQRMSESLGSALDMRPQPQKWMEPITGGFLGGPLPNIDDYSENRMRFAGELQQRAAEAAAAEAAARTGALQMQMMLPQSAIQNHFSNSWGSYAR